MRIGTYFGVAAIVAAVANVTAFALEDRLNIEFVETQRVEGFYIGVTDDSGHTNTTFNARLCFSIWTTNGPTYAAIPLGTDYKYQADLFDTNGIAIKKTRAGKNLGGKFLDFNPDAAILMGTGPDRAHMEEIQKIFVDKKKWPYQIQTMFRPSDLFQIEKPGIYKLQIRFQIVTFPKMGTNRLSQARQLVRFPVLNYSLVHPEK